MRPPARARTHPRTPHRPRSVTGRRRRRRRSPGSGGAEHRVWSRRGGRAAAWRPPRGPPSSALSASPLAAAQPGTGGAAAPSPPGTSTEARAAGALRPQSPGRGGGEPGLSWQSRACECLRVKARAARRSALTPPAPAQVSAAPEPPVCAPRHARSSHEHQRSQGVSGPERNPSAFRGRGLGLAETDGEIRAGHPRGSGYGSRAPSHLDGEGHASEGACRSSLARLPGGSCLSGGLPGPWMARLLSGGWARKPPSRKSSFSLQTGSESRLPPAHPSDADSQGGLAGSGRPRTPGARIRPGGYPGT